MPKTARSDADIEEVKDEILDHAMDIIAEKGFSNFSMRMLASRLGMTAANIYNYYMNKDDLYLSIQTRGFELLYSCFDLAEKKGKDLREKMENMIRAYIDFGILNPNYYDIMFSMNTPKYADYIGTEMEPKAYTEKQTALKVLEVTSRVMLHLFAQAPAPKKGDPKYQTLRLWNLLHGMVSLYNSRVLQEAEEDTEGFKNRMIEDMILEFIPG